MSEFTDKDFKAIEKAVLETERGRWFLSEYARRNRAADTDALLVAMRRLETAVVRQPSALAHVSRAEMEHLSEIIADTEKAIARIRNDLADNAGPIDDGEDVFAHLAAMSRRLADDIGAIRDRLIDLTEGSSHDLHDIADRLEAVGLSHDVLSQRVGKAMALLGHIRAQLLRGEADWQIGASPGLSADTLAFFASDEELFVPEPAPAAEPEPPVAVDAVADSMAIEPAIVSSPNNDDAPAAEVAPAEDEPAAEALARADTVSERLNPVPDIPGEHHDIPLPDLADAEGVTADQPADEASPEPALAAVDIPPLEPQVPDGAVTATRDDRERIVIIRSGAAGRDIPLADSLEEDTPRNTSQAG